MDEKEIRRFCLEKAIEIFSWRKEFFFRKNYGPLQLADVIYRFITEGKVEEFELPGTKG
ncbi:MAG: hypothetical protein Q4D56_12805 [Bacteroides sp.]|nr:hypothetical protein [Bacteroides sp.]